jgi:endonuclease/exonuclease/phosphatase family metal-dependent hydrolase
MTRRQALLMALPSLGVAETRLVDRLRKLTPEEWRVLRENPDHLRPAELNALVPMLEEIEILNTESDGPASSSLRVVAWNIERGRGWKEAAALMREHPALQNAAIVCLSEMDLGMARSGNLNTTREMASALGMNYLYGIEFLEFTKGGREERKAPGENEYGYHGNAILSRFPLYRPKLLRFPGIEKWYFDYGKRLGGRMALIATIAVQRQLITVVSTHLESGAFDAEARRQEMERILAELPTDRPVILGGDLNANPAEPTIQLLREAGFEIDKANDLKSPTSQRLINGKVTLAGNHIDYICVRGLKAQEPAVIGTQEFLSDHAAVSAVVSF